MPKYYHGKACGVGYSARAVGFWRRFPLWFLPYLTGDVIRIHLNLKRELDWWPEGILRIDPPIVSDMSNMPGGWSGEPIVLSNWAFRIEDIEAGKTWSATLPLMGGLSFGQPCEIRCHVDLQKVDGEKVVRGGLHIANVEVVSRGPFITHIVMWASLGIMSLAALIVGILALIS